MPDFTIPTYEHIVRINQTLVTRYGGAGHHVLNGGPLHNALHVVAGPIFDVDQFPTLPDKAAKLAWAIATGHVFGDGNKRTAASVLDLVLNLNGSILAVAEDDLVNVMYQLAQNAILFDSFVAWTSGRCLPNSI